MGLKNVWRISMNKNKKFLLYGHGGSHNHGAEAIIRTTVEIIKNNYPNSKIILSTHFKEQDVEFGIDVDEYCERDMYYVELAKSSHVKGKYDNDIYKSTIDKIDKNTVCLSVGGDNYCYDNWRRWRVIHEKAIETGAKSILWSCSIEPSMMDKEMLDTLRTHHAITARENITYNSLKEYGLNNVVLCSDVAFALMPQGIALPDNFVENNTVGINISPLVVRREAKPGIILENIINLIKYIIENTNMNVALIPHVVMSMDNDYALLKEIYDRFNSCRICLISDKLNASQYKYVISKCRVGVFARTHATIAAYSSGIPCIAIGYSVKAVGIGHDLGVGDYVMGLDKFLDKFNLCTMFKTLIKDEKIFSYKLKKIMDTYVENSRNYEVINALR